VIVTPGDDPVYTTVPSTIMVLTPFFATSLGTNENVGLLPAETATVPGFKSGVGGDWEM